MTVEGYQTYNAADDLINRNLQTGRSDRIAVIDSAGSHSYGRMAEKINQFANFITQSGIKREDRILLCLNDTLDFPICFLGAIKAGVIPIPVNTRLTEDDYRYILNDSRANMLIVSKDLSEFFFNHLNDHDNLEQTIISKGDIDGYQNLSASLEGQSTSFEAAATSADDMCFWLYTSGTTGKPKGTVHIHSSLLATADLYAVPTLGISDQDVVYSAAKLFFAYGLGNGLTFPFAVGATVILLEGPPAPDDVCRILRENRPTIFYGVPTLSAYFWPVTSYRKRASITCVSARRPAKRCLPIFSAVGANKLAQIFWTVSAAPKCCISLFPTGKRMSGQAQQVKPFQDTISGLWMMPVIR